MEMMQRQLGLPIVRVLLTVAVVSATAMEAATAPEGPDSASSAARRGRFYSVHNLVSDGFVRADHFDADLVNPWGIAFNPTAVDWVNDNGTGKSTLYDGLGAKNSLVVTIPPPPSTLPPSAPTGIVFSGGSDFMVMANGLAGPSRFMFATEDGTISGWAPNVDVTHAILVVNNSASEAIYKGLALAANGTGRFLYATDFHNRKIDVFDSTFAPVTLPGAFFDPRIPQKYAPFGIQNILGNLYVTYAKQDDDGEDDVAGSGFGFVDVFDANGQLIRRFASHDRLNAPWGMALAPADFGRFSNALLVGNFGDGLINAFDLATGESLGPLRAHNGTPVSIEGLWGIAFGNGVLTQPTNTLFFAAGPGDEEHGVYGRIDPIARP